jgi:iron-sulfur cluster repair protein YtfE (RIC family)
MAFESLKEDHKKVAALFSRAESAQSDEQKQQLFEQIRTELENHTQIEETVLYPTLQKYEDLKDYVLEAVEEHRQVKTLLQEIGRLTDGSEKFDAKLKVMKENIEHHVEEEENEMFPNAQKTLSKDELAALEQELETARKGLRKASTARSGNR